eukprot:comp6890_c0_seq1/m.2640 comp6890_c0_seq1/g.2640  ORF comp6890_c0_seq1/g.2640 comp6890_c0_seq1/m.2640 type:complete len:269 (-) comp6890_c0_seq1:2-808(-)
MSTAQNRPSSKSAPSKQLSKHRHSQQSWGILGAIGGLLDWIPGVAVARRLLFGQKGKRPRRRVRRSRKSMVRWLVSALPRDQHGAIRWAGNNSSIPMVANPAAGKGITFRGRKDSQSEEHIWNSGLAEMHDVISGPAVGSGGGVTLRVDVKDTVEPSVEERRKEQGVGGVVVGEAGAVRKEGQEREEGEGDGDADIDEIQRQIELLLAAHAGDDESEPRVRVEVVAVEDVETNMPLPTVKAGVDSVDAQERAAAALGAMLRQMAATAH